MQSIRNKSLEVAVLRLLRKCNSGPPSSLLRLFSFTTLTRRKLTGSGLPRSDVFLSDSVPWSAMQTRGAKMLGSDVRLGNVIQRKGRIYQVIKAQHTHQGRGGAIIQVELRDLDTGNKLVERFRTDEALEKVFVEEKTLTFLFREGNSVTLMEPETFEQLEVSKEFFGKSSAYLKEDMEVTLQYYDGKPMSGTVPTRVNCRVVEAQPNTKGLTAAPQFKRVLLDNGLTVMAPPFVEVGDEIVVNTLDDSYITRAKE